MTSFGHKVTTNGIRVTIGSACKTARVPVETFRVTTDHFAGCRNELQRFPGGDDEGDVCPDNECSVQQIARSSLGEQMLCSYLEPVALPWRGETCAGPRSADHKSVRWLRFRSALGFG